MRILWISNSPYQPTGYGQQTALFTKALRDAGHDVRIWATFQSDPWPTYDGMPIYRSQVADPQHSLNGLSKVVHRIQPDLIIFLADPWIFDLTELRHTGARTQLAWWLPVDTDPLPQSNFEALELCDYILPMSPHGVAMLDEAGFGYQLPIPHGIDTDIFTPLDIEPTGQKVIGMVQANIGTRKLIALQLEAFALAVPHVDNLILYVHTDLSGSENPRSSLDYTGLLKYFNIQNLVFSSDGALPTDAMAEMYNRFDLLLNTTAGEGFGVPIVEAMACGVPSITTKNSAQQYTNPFKQLQVEPVVREFVTPIQSFYSWPSATDVAERIVNFFEDEKWSAHREAVSTMAQQYDVNRVVKENWLPFLEEAARDPVRV